MTDAAEKLTPPNPTNWSSQAMQKRIAKRYAAERRFKFLGLAAVTLSVAFLVFLLFVMLSNGVRGFSQTEIDLPVDFSELNLIVSKEQLRSGDGKDVLTADIMRDFMNTAIVREFGGNGMDSVPTSSWHLARDMLIEDPDSLDKKAVISVPVATPLDIAYKGTGSPEAEAKVQELSDRIQMQRTRPRLEYGVPLKGP